MVYDFVFSHILIRKWKCDQQFHTEMETIMSTKKPKQKGSLNYACINIIVAASTLLHGPKGKHKRTLTRQHIIHCFENFQLIILLLVNLLHIAEYSNLQMDLAQALFHWLNVYDDK